ncbi:MAG: DUF4347 domain-containing protein, partial [Magnetococcus sp. THC-1_WYH]
MLHLKIQGDAMKTSQATYHGGQGGGAGVEKPRTDVSWGKPLPFRALALEPRLLFDGGVVAGLIMGLESGMDPLDPEVTESHPTHTMPNAPGMAELQPLLDLWERAVVHPKNMVFIDARVPDLATLVQGVPPDTQVEIIQGEDDGIARITQCLADKKNLESIQIISHGEPGKIILGHESLDLATLAEDKTAVARWGEALKTGGDLLLYGCDVAAGTQGEAFLRALAHVTKADVGASVDATGQAALGGDWDLEHRVGPIEASWALASKATDDFSGLLANQVVTNTNDSGAGSLRQAVTDIGAGETITFDATAFDPGTVAANLRTINLASGIAISGLVSADITIDGDVDGDNKADVIINGGGVGPFSIFSIAKNATLKSLELTDGTGTAGKGGDVYINGGTVVIEDTSMTSGSAAFGGGLYVTTANVTLTRCTVSGNTATTHGGGIYSLGTLTMINSTVSGNTAANSGGGCYLSTGGVATIDNSTITANMAKFDNAGVTDYGGGIYMGGGSISVSHTLIAGNYIGSAGTVTDDVNSNAAFTSFTSRGYNLIGDGDGSSGFTGTGDQVGTGASPLSPGVSALADNGGTTQTHALTSNSLAINTGNAAYAGGLTTDQAGQTRPVGIIDIGSYEYQTTANTSPTATHTTVTTTYTEDAASVALTDIVVTDNDVGETITAQLTLADIAAGSLTTTG